MPGTVVNLDRVRAQMEGAVIFGMSIALYGAITAKGGAVEQTNFRDYRIVRMGEVPRQDPRRDRARATRLPGGVGEPGVPPVAPAIANAVFALTGKRMRELPLLGTPAALDPPTGAPCRIHRERVAAPPPAILRRALGRGSPRPRAGRAASGPG